MHHQIITKTYNTMGLKTFLFGDKLTQLQDRSNRAVTVFSKTAADLASVNMDIETEQNRIRVTQEKLAIRDEVLLKQKTKNTNLLHNINKFLGNVE